MKLRLIFGALLVFAAHAHLLSFLRRRAGRLRTRRALRLAIGIAALVTATAAIESRIVRFDPPSWLLWLYAPASFWVATLTQAWPFLIALDLGLALAGRRRAVHGRLRTDARSTVHGDDRPEPADVSAPIDEGRRRALAQIGAGAAFASFGGVLAYGAFKTRLDVEIVELPIRVARLPKVLDGFTIVQVSDIHVSAFFGERELARAEEIVAGLRPDLIAMTGDLVHGRPSDLAVGAAWLRRLGPRARHGVTAILGNHEYYVGRDPAMAAMRAAGADVLFNTGKIVAPDDGGGIALVGTDDYVGDTVPPQWGPKIAAPLRALPPDAPRIVLCHQPQFFDQAALHGVDLQLSGHTHGGQIAPFGPLVSKPLFRYVRGLYTRGDARLYVNRGLGTSGPPSRVAVRPEITKIVLVAG